ncbi:MAG TPA: amidohydrolase family protein [Anaeromyxobacteraceae bacterium]|jgi:hypothetical protein|nr:amidohydrolase family protein [Anaeromyxobacteraceae bacterium]
MLASSLVLIATALALSPSPMPAGVADAVYLNGSFYTLDERQPRAEAVAIRDGRFLRVGRSAEVRGLIGPATRVVDLHGSFVLPGLIDAHTHPSLEARFPYRPWDGFPWTWLKSRAHRFELPALPSSRVRALADAARIMSSYGFTAFGDGYVPAAQLPAWEELIRRGELRQHAVLFMPVVVPGAAPLPARRLAEEFGRYRLPGLRLGAKLFVDGYLESESAYLTEPYAGRADARGSLATPAATLDALVDELDRAGLPLQLHAIGDGGVHAALDAVAKAVAGRAGRPGPVHAIVHARLVREDDLPRLVELGVALVPDVFLAQPSPVDLIAAKIGSRRREERYLALKRLWDAGALVGVGSDWASASMDPYYGMYVGVTRRAPHHPERGAMGEGNGVALERMIRSYTLNNARILGLAGETGSIEAGKSADFAVLDRDILRRPIEELLETRVLATIFEGRVVHDGRPLPPGLARSEEELLEIGHAH